MLSVKQRIRIFVNKFLKNRKKEEKIVLSDFSPIQNIVEGMKELPNQFRKFGLVSVNVAENKRHGMNVVGTQTLFIL